MLVGPVDLLVLSFPQEDADPGVIAAVQEVVEAGFVTVLDLVFLSGLRPVRSGRSMCRRSWTASVSAISRSRSRR